MQKQEAETKAQKDECLKLKPDEDAFLKSLQQKLQKFPKEQQDALIFDKTGKFEDDLLPGKLSRDILMEALNEIADYYDLKLVLYSPRRESGKFYPMLTFVGMNNKSIFPVQRRDARLESIQSPFVQALENAYKSGTRTPIQPADIGSEDVKIFTSAVQNYKIHLMPKKQDIPEIIYLFLKEINHNKKFRESISEFKFNIAEPELHNEQNIPTIVIYAMHGKKRAQIVLDEIYRLLNKFEGIAHAPRWNEKVTNLIWWAQGDGGNKSRRPYFYAPGDDSGNGRATFRADITGVLTDYHLKDPSTASKN